MDARSQGHEPPLTARTLQTALAAQPTGAAAHALAARLRSQIGSLALAQGGPPLIDEVTVAWAIEALQAQDPPLVISERGLPLHAELTRLGDTAVYALALDLPEGSALHTAYLVDGRRPEGADSQTGRVEVYRRHPDSRVQPGIPQGTLLDQPRWRSTIFAGTVRDWWLYVPAQYQADQPACVMVFQDGRSYTDSVPTVFDNLIAAGAITSSIAMSSLAFCLWGRRPPARSRWVERGSTVRGRLRHQCIVSGVRA